MIPDRFPLPRIEDIFDNLGKAKYFSVVDLQAGYHQIPLDEESRKYTAFSTKRGMFEYNVLPFGLSIAPSSFSRMMALAFSGLTPERCFSYMDDLIIIGFSEENHLNNIRSVFEICRKYNLKLNPAKCEFFRTEISFLGHICTDKGLKADPKKLLAVEKYPKPTDKDSVKRFVAFANYYRRFVPNFAELAKPLTNLTKKRSKFIWNTEAENSFQTLRQALLHSPILKYPDFEKEFKIIVDASDFACGAVLTQNYDGMDMPITYISRAFKKGELNKPPIEKELLGVHFAITQLRPYIYGRHFIVKSDHKPLIYLYNLKNPSSKLTRIRLELEEYDFTIEYIKGKDNIIADALSRITIEDFKEMYDDLPIFVITRAQSKQQKHTGNDKTIDIDTSDVKIYQDFMSGFNKRIPKLKTTQINANDKNEIKSIKMSIFKSHRKLLNIELANERLTLKSIISKMQIAASNANIREVQLPINDGIFKICTLTDFKMVCNNELNELKIILIKQPTFITDTNERFKILEKFHNDPLYGGHPGQKKLYAKIRQNYYWPKMTKEIAKYVRQCEKCRLNKHERKTKEKMMITPTPARPLDVVVIDTIGPLMKSNRGNSYAVTMICELTKHLTCAAVRDKSAKEVAKAIFEKFILKYGPMRRIRTDRGTEYLNELFKELCKLMGIAHDISTAYHHESLGSIERNHREFNHYLRQYLDNNLTDWDTYLEYFEFCYNVDKHGSTNYKYSPFELVYLRSPNLSSDLLHGEIDPLYDNENFIKEAKYRLQKAHKQTIELMNRMKINNKKQYDKRANPIKLNIGDEVGLTNEPYNKHLTLRKKYFVVGLNHPNVFLSDGSKTIEVHKNRVLKI